MSKYSGLLGFALIIFPGYDANDCLKRKTARVSRQCRIRNVLVLTYKVEVFHENKIISGYMFISLIYVYINTKIFAFYYAPVFWRDVLWYSDVCPSVRPSVRPAGSPSVGHSCLHFSPTCFDILNTWQINKNKQNSILEIHIFPHFFPTCFDIFSWNVEYAFVILYYKPSSIVVNLRQCL